MRRKARDPSKAAERALVSLLDARQRHLQASGVTILAVERGVRAWKRPLKFEPRRSSVPIADEAHGYHSTE